MTEGADFYLSVSYKELFFGAGFSDTDDREN